MERNKPEAALTQGCFCHNHTMWKKMLQFKLDERRSWACNDCRTYLYAKCQNTWSDYEAYLGGGNMAKPLILFAFWDVMAGIYAHHEPEDKSLLWKESDGTFVQEKIDAIKVKLKELSKEDSRYENFRVIGPTSGKIVNDEKALKVLLESFADKLRLGVEPKVFAHNIRPKYRNKLAHTYSPELKGGTYSSGPRPMDFGQLLGEVHNYEGTVVVVDEGVFRIDGVAMLRDTDVICDQLQGLIKDEFTEDESRRSLDWLGLIDREIAAAGEESSD